MTKKGLRVDTNLSHPPAGQGTIIWTMCGGGISGAEPIDDLLSERVEARGRPMKGCGK